MELPERPISSLYSHIDEQTPLTGGSRRGQAPSQISTAADPSIVPNSSTRPTFSRFSLESVRRFFSYSQQHPYQNIPDRGHAIEITSPLHEQTYQGTLIDNASATAASWPPISKESSALLATADRLNMECWNEFYKLSSQKQTRNPAPFLQLLEKSAAVYKEYTHSTEIVFASAAQECLANNNPSLTPSLVDLFHHSHDASMNYLLRLQSEVERLEKLVDNMTAAPPHLSFPAEGAVATSPSGERERLLPASAPSLTSRQLTEAISSLKQKMSTASDTYLEKIEADISFLNTLARPNQDSSQLVSPFIEKLQTNQTRLQKIQSQQQNDLQTTHQLFQQHLDDLLMETEEADRQINTSNEEDAQKTSAAFSKSIMRLWEATQSFKGLHQKYNPVEDHLQTVYGTEYIFKRIKEKSSPRN